MVEEVRIMKMERVIISLPSPLKRKLEVLRGQGYSMAGFIRRVLERELKMTKKGR